MKSTSGTGVGSKSTRWAGRALSAGLLALLGASSTPGCSAPDRATIGTVTESVIADGAPNGVIGQADYASGLAGTGPDRLRSPSRVTADASGGLYVTDTGNHRVLYFPVDSLTAARFYGQPTPAGAVANAGGVSANSLNGPRGVALLRRNDGSTDGLYVVDTDNHRVLFFDGEEVIATRVIGQTDFDRNTPPAAARADRLRSPEAATLDASGNLYVADTFNNRVVMFAPGGTQASRVYGQAGDFTGGLTNMGGIASADSLSAPSDVAVDPTGGLYIADSGNMRVLHYSGDTTTADRVYGQSSMTSIASNAGGLGADTLRLPRGVFAHEGDLFISDTGNHRVLWYSGTSTSAHAVLGQLGAFSTGTSNSGGVTAFGLSGPTGLTFDANSLIVVDVGNHRVLRFDASCETSGCDDGNPCTRDSCRANGVCRHSPISGEPAACGGYACDETAVACRTRCDADADCAGDHQCNAGRCTRECQHDGDCDGPTPCVDGWCCESTCDGECQRCNAEGTEGQCQTTESGVDPRLECSGYACSGTGACLTRCDGPEDCHAGAPCTRAQCVNECSSDADCAGTSCVDGVCCTERSCSAGYTCAYSDAVRGTCRANQGVSCTDDRQCGSGHCVDDVCCDSACDGACESCNQPGRPGLCTALAMGTDPDAECTGDDTCGGTCDGAGACQFPPRGAVCLEVGCYGAELVTEAALCPGDGASCPVAERTPCPGRLTCENAERCHTLCTEAGQCVAGHACQEGFCRPNLPTGCTRDGDCSSGHCSDGYCCDRACDGTCESCARSGLTGTCTPYASGDDPELECSDGEDVCTGACNGVGSCAPAAATVACAPAACVDGHTLGAVALCTGDGTCGDPVPLRCAPGLCQDAACTLECKKSAECASGAFCDSGRCVFDKGERSGCSVPEHPRQRSTGSGVLLLALALVRARRRSRPRRTPHA